MEKTRGGGWGLLGDRDSRGRCWDTSWSRATTCKINASRWKTMGMGRAHVGTEPPPRPQANPHSRGLETGSALYCSSVFIRKVTLLLDRRLSSLPNKCSHLRLSVWCISGGGQGPPNPPAFSQHWRRFSASKGITENSTTTQKNTKGKKDFPLCVMCGFKCTHLASKSKDNTSLGDGRWAQSGQ